MNDFQLELCDRIISVGRRLHSGGYVVSNDGNISVRCGQQALITPTGVSKGALERDMLLLVDMDGSITEGSCAPSVETPLHLTIYNHAPRVKAVVHAHPYNATLCSILGIALDMPVLAETVLGVGMIPLAPFAEPSTDQLAESVLPFLDRYNGCLMANHGAVTWADSVEKAFYQMEQIEFFAKITLGILNQSRPPRLLSREQISRLLEIKKRISGHGSIRIPLGAENSSNLEAVFPEGYDEEI